MVYVQPFSFPLTLQWANVLDTLYEAHPAYGAQIEFKRLKVQKEKLEKTLISARKALTTVAPKAQAE